MGRLRAELRDRPDVSHGHGGKAARAEVWAETITQSGRRFMVYGLWSPGGKRSKMRLDFAKRERHSLPYCKNLFLSK